MVCIPGYAPHAPFAKGDHGSRLLKRSNLGHTGETIQYWFSCRATLQFIVDVKRAYRSVTQLAAGSIETPLGLHFRGLVTKQSRQSRKHLVHFSRRQLLEVCRFLPPANRRPATFNDQRKTISPWEERAEAESACVRADYEVMQVERGRGKGLAAHP